MILKGRYLLGSHREILEGGAVRIAKGRITERGRGLSPFPGETVVDAGDAVLLPGWVNAHVHLELSLLEGRLPRGRGFVPWVEELLRERAGKDEGFFREGVARGLAAALASGTTTLADVTTSSLSAEILRGRKVRAVVFEEGIALEPDRAAEAMQRLGERVERLADAGPHTTAGIAPHAPYTVSAELFRLLDALASERGLPGSVHLSETEEEVRMFETGDGPLVEFLDSIGAIPPGWTAPGCRPVRFLDELGMLRRRPLLVHCNYLDEDDVTRIAASGAPVVVCPRSHRFFGHEEHPFPHLREAGVPLALGTDSLASNDSLSMLDEVREVHRWHPELNPWELFDLAQGGGARALGLAGEVGRLDVGQRADMVGYAVRAGAPGEGVLREVLEEAGDPVLVVAHGTILEGGGD